MASGQTIRLVGDSQRAFAKRLIDAAPADAVVNIREATRTSAQNDLMWALLSDVARAKPEGRTIPTDRWKCLFMDACGYKADWEPGLDGGVVNMGYRSSRLTKAQMSDVIECIREYGARHEIKWSAPAESS